MATVSQIIRRRRRRRALRRAAQHRSQLWTILFVVMFFCVVVIPGLTISVVVASAYFAALEDFPESREATIALEPAQGNTQIYDASGQTLLLRVEDPLGDRRSWVTLDTIPEPLVQATILWEDPDFLKTTSFKPIQLITDIWDNWVNGPFEARPSMSRQLVRNILVPVPDVVTVDSAAKEISLVAEVQRLYSPEEILEWHLNTNDYGNRIQGIQAAAEVYFGKSVGNLTLDEIAMLAAIPTQPSLNPIDSETAARSRQSDLLRRMLANDIITRSEFEAAINVNSQIRHDAGQLPLLAPEFTNYAREQAETILESFGMNGSQAVARGGLHIVTTLDVDLYAQADCMLQAHLARLNNQPEPETTVTGGPCFATAYLEQTAGVGEAPPDSGAIMILDPQTGVVRAMVGDATEAIYQPGQTLHPFVYLDGFLNAQPNYTAATMLLDIPQPFPGSADGLLYVPENPDGQERGPLSLREAMGAGLLPPVVDMAHVLNLNRVLRDTVSQMGINSLRSGIYDLSLLEQGGAVSVLDVAYAYSVFASLGQMNGVPVPSNDRGLRNHDPVAVQRIEAADGTVLWEYGETPIVVDDVRLPNRVPLLQPEAAYLVNDILSDPEPKLSTLNNVDWNINREAALVQALTSSQTDNWTVGYTPQVVTVVHLGRADRGVLTLQGYGAEGSIPVWSAIMRYTQERDGLPATTWQRPQTIAETLVCEISGMAPNGACETRPEIFLSEGQFPPEDTYWQLVQVNTQTNQLATANTPATLSLTRAYFVPPDEALDWWVLNDLPLPPTQYDIVSRPDIVSSAVILRPENLAIIGGEVDIRGSVDGENMEYFVLAYGAGPNPDAWFDITPPQYEYVPGTSLGLWNTSTLDGNYVLRLTVVMQDGTLETDIVQAIVDNIPPSVILTAGEPGQTFVLPADRVIPLVAEVSDNIRIDYVEFYHNGQFVGIDEDFPFGYDHTINRTGQETFTAVVFDATGNQSETSITVTVQRNDGG